MQSLSALTRLTCAVPKIFSVTKPLITRRSTPIFTGQCMAMSKRKGFDWLPPDLNKEDDNDLNKEDDNDQNKVHLAGKYTVFKDEDADIILDVDEERALKAQGFRRELKEKEKVETDYFEGINLERGKEGVFDVDDLLHVLKVNNAESIFVATLPEELQYATYIVIVSGKSKKHMDAIATFVRKVYKMKVKSQGPIPHLEGQTSYDWLALDLGNIILHIMSHKARKFYDLECLWSVGPEHDSKINDPDDPLVALLEEHTINLSDFQPMDPRKDPSTEQQSR
nr:PREDICTED: uncharacterized protein LOC109043743 isoform X2 [Bemisia tabaci]